MNEVFDPIRKLIEVHFNTEWTAVGGSVPIEWEEVPFNQPASGTWIRVSIRDGQGFQASIGSKRLEKQPGVVMIGVFVPKNDGTGKIRGIADKAGQALRYRQLTDGSVTVSFEAPFVTRGPEQETHLQLNVNVPFEAQHVTQ